MDNSAKNRVPESFHQGSSMPGPERKAEERINSREVREASDIGKSAYVEAVGLDESLETTGKVSEVLNGSAEGQGDGVAMGKKAAQALTIAQIRQNLLNSVPSENEMREQIGREIRKEIDYLHSKALKMFRSPGKMSYFEMANLMKKIRELKGILIELVKASIDGLKTLWLRFVHQIM